MFIGKLVELKTVDGIYRGTVSEAGTGKVLLESVEFVDTTGFSSFLPRIRISKNDLIDTGIKVLKSDSDIGPSDPVSIYNTAEQRLSCRGGRRADIPPRFQMRSKSQQRPVDHRTWDSDVGNVFPSDKDFEIERQQHEAQLIRVGNVRSMQDYYHYFVLDNPEDCNFREAMQLITSGSIARVGLSIFGSPLNRTTRPSWIAVATPRGVLLFDVRFMNATTIVSCGLAKFLSTPPEVLPRKIMHDCRQAADSLKHCLNINLNIYCDTLAMETCMFMHDSNGKMPRNAWPLTDLLFQYCPKGKDFDLLEHRFNVAQYEYEYEIWNARPAKESVMHLACALTVHLCDLYDSMMKRLMAPIQICTGILANSFRNLPTAPFTTKESLTRLPDAIAELKTSPQANFVNNPVGEKNHKTPANVSYKEGLLRCGMGYFVASSGSAAGYVRDV